MVGLVRQTSLNPLLLTQGHQVLAHAYVIDGDVVTLHVYDPNWPARDDIRIAGSAIGLAAVDRGAARRHPRPPLTAPRQLS